MTESPEDLVCTIGSVPEEAIRHLSEGEFVVAVLPENKENHRYWLHALSDGRVAVISMKDR